MVVSRAMRPGAGASGEKCGVVSGLGFLCSSINNVQRNRRNLLHSLLAVSRDLCRHPPMLMVFLAAWPACVLQTAQPVRLPSMLFCHGSAGLQQYEIATRLQEAAEEVGRAAAFLFPTAERSVRGFNLV